MRKISLIVLALAGLILSCSNDDGNNEPPPTGGYQLVLEDSTVVTIPGNAVAFAQQNYSRDAQLMREYQIASQEGWTLPLQSWKLSGYDVRQSYMVPPYDHDVMTDDSAFFYYEIGEFMEQFGYGWKDTFDAGTFNPDSAYVINIWPSDAPETVFFDGQSSFAAQYRGMWSVE